MAKETICVDLHEDGEHLWIEGKQFVSLERFLKVTNEIKKEARILEGKYKTILKENERLKETVKILSQK